jgi:poly(3-hydroxybutyrate) depolymerase
MRTTILSFVFLISTVVSSFAAAAPVRYIDNIFTNVTTTSNVTYGSNKNYDNSTVTLRLDVYQPTGDTASKRPLFVFVHGGGFTGGSKLDYDMPLLCNAFAKKGWICVSPDYRTDPQAGGTRMLPAVVRSVQDVKAAVRYMRANKAQYKIDDTKIFVGGTSAGGVIADQYDFLDNNELAKAIDTTATGGVEGASGTPGVSSAINGIQNCWGCVFDSTILNNRAQPIISFAGTLDAVVPYDHNGATYGSAGMHRILTRLGYPSIFYSFVGLQHGTPTDARFDTIVFMTARFAYDIMFGGTSTMHIEKSTSRAEQQSAMQSITLGLASAGRNTILTRQGTVYSLDGRASRMSADTRNVGSAAGIYIFQPDLK